MLQLLLSLQQETKIKGKRGVRSSEGSKTYKNPEKQQIPDSQVLSKPMLRIQALSRSASLSPQLNFCGVRSNPLKKVATADRDSVLSSYSGEKEKMSPPTTQELVVGSSAEMETKSTHLPVAVQTSPPTTIQPADTSAPPLPATEDEATRKERSETFRRTLDKFRTYEKLQAGESSSSDLKKDSGSRKKEKMSLPTTQELVVGSSAGMETKSTHPPVAVQTSPPTTIQPADTSALPLPATEDEATRKERSETFRRTLDTFRTYENLLDFSESPSSDSKKVATADDVSVLSSDSGLDSGGSSSSDLKKDSFQSSDSRCVSRKEKARSYHRDIDFKKNPDLKCALRPVSAPVQLNFCGVRSNPLKKVATADRYSVLSSDSGLDFRESSSSDSVDVATSDDDSDQSSHSQISLERKVSSKLRRVSSKRTKPYNRIDSKKNKPVMCIEGPFRAASLSDLWNFAGSHFLYLKITFATADGDSVLSLDSGIYLERKVSSKYKRVSSKRMKPYNRIDSKKKVSVDRGSSETSCVSMKSDSSRGVVIIFKGEEEKDELPITQELVVGSSAEMETKSTPVAVPTRLLTTIQPADTSTHPLPATRDKAKRKWGTKMFRRVRTMFRRNEKSP